MLLTEGLNSPQRGGLFIAMESLKPLQFHEERKASHPFHRGGDDGVKVASPVERERAGLLRLG